MVSLSVNLNEWQCKDIVDENDDQVRDCMTKMDRVFLRRRKQFSLVKIASGKNKAGRESVRQGHFVVGQVSD